MNKLLIIIIITSLFSNCEKKPQRTVLKGFYYWKSIYNLSGTERDLLDTLNVEKLYVKFFDVSWDKIHRAVPLAQVKFESAIPDSIQLIPVVFITNKTLINSKLEETDVLATRISDKISDIKKYSKVKSIREIQLDCDWSVSTKDKYFNLVKKVKENNPGILISVTIRLHQIKYYNKTGVPPADKGLLMLYNMGAIRKYDTKNSLFDLSEASKYINSKTTYPIKLDIALPAYSWGVVFRNKKFLGLINNLNKQEISKEQFLKKTERKNLFQVTEDKVFRNIYLRKGDEIRLEDAPAEILNESSEICKNLLQDSSTVSLYHLDDNLKNNYSNEELSSIYNSFR